MRLFVSHMFESKLASLTPEQRTKVAGLARRLEGIDRAGLGGVEGLDVRDFGSDVLTLHIGRDAQLLATIGTDAEGEYLLLIDVVSASPKAREGTRFFAPKDPRTNPSIDPNRNMTIDPRRNMTIDPRRNMTIDPNRNMTIDPRRNMTIDPKRNMTIDPNRNMTIDPRRNMSIDPLRNMTIDPRRNRSYGGPFLYDTNLNQTGFVVRVNNRVSLLFDPQAKYCAFAVRAGESKNTNLFGIDGSWNGFLVDVSKDVTLRFEPSGAWVGLVA